MLNSPFKIKEINLSSTWVYNVPKNSDCTICRCNLNTPSLYNFEKGMDSYVVSGKCLHSFHQECIKPWIEEVDRNIESYKKMIGDVNEVAKITKGVGIQFGYHNHNFEFKNTNGIVPYYDIFLKEMDADLVTMELDLFWASKAGQDPVAMFKKYPGRFQLLHFKDMRTNQPPFFEVIKDDICSVGVGVIDFKKILQSKEIGGMKYLFVEDDNQGNGKPFEGIETSIKNITTKILKS